MEEVLDFLPVDLSVSFPHRKRSEGHTQSDEVPKPGCHLRLPVLFPRPIRVRVSGTYHRDLVCTPFVGDQRSKAAVSFLELL